MTVEDDLRDRLRTLAGRAPVGQASAGTVAARVRERARRRRVARTVAVVACAASALAVLVTARLADRQSSIPAVATTAPRGSTVAPGPPGTIAAASTTTTAAASTTTATSPPTTALATTSSPTAAVDQGTATSAAPATSTSAAGVASGQRCRSAELAAELGPPGYGAGQVYVPLLLRNVGGRTCQLKGYPGVSLLDGAGNQLGEPAGREPQTPALVTLGPGEVASALLHTTNGPIGGPCQAASTRVKVYPPNEVDALVVAGRFTACGGFTVRPVVVGPTGT